MADVVIGAKLEADASGAIGNVRNFKKELMLAQQEVVALSEKFGATSKEAAAAAKKAAELKDTIGDAKSLVDAFNPDTKFQAFGASINTVVGGFTALTGAMALLGVESEEVQKTLLKVQSALALSQGISQLQQGMQAFKNLGSVLVNTLGKSGLIGIAIAGVTALGLALAGVFSKKYSEAQKALNESLKEFNKESAQARKEVYLIKDAFKQAEKGVISKAEALKKYNEGIGKTIGFTNDLNDAERLVADNAAAYIEVQGLKAQANYILSKSAELAGNAEIQRFNLEKSGLKGVFAKTLKKDIDEQTYAAKSLEVLLGTIEDKIQKASAGFRKSGLLGQGGARAGGTADKGKDSPAAKVKQEEDAATLEFSQAYENRFQRALDLQKSFAANKKAIVAQEIADDKASDDERLANARAYYANQIAIAQEERDLKIMFANEIGGVLNGLSQLIGEQTAAGKVFAIAAATIDTYAAIAAQLAAASKSPGAAIPGWAIAQAVATGIFGLIQVKKIIATKVPGGGGGGSVGSVSAPLTARLPQETSTRLNQGQLNQIGNAAVRAFVVEADVTNNQERIRRINRQARIG